MTPGRHGGHWKGGSGGGNGGGRNGGGGGSNRNRNRNRHRNRRSGQGGHRDGHNSHNSHSGHHSDRWKEAQHGRHDRDNNNRNFNKGGGGEFRGHNDRIVEGHFNGRRDQGHNQRRNEGHNRRREEYGRDERRANSWKEDRRVDMKRRNGGEDDRTRSRNGERVEVKRARRSSSTDSTQSSSSNASSPLSPSSTESEAASITPPPALEKEGGKGAVESGERKKAGSSSGQTASLTTSTSVEKGHAVSASASNEKLKKGLAFLVKTSAIPTKTIVNEGARSMGGSREKPKIVICPIQKSAVFSPKTIVNDNDSAKNAGEPGEKPKIVIGPIQKSAIFPAKTIVNESAKSAAASGEKPKIVIGPIQKSAVFSAKTIVNESAKSTGASVEKPKIAIGPMQKSAVITPAKTIVNESAKSTGGSGEKPKIVIGPMQKSAVIPPAKPIIPTNVIADLQKSTATLAKTLVNGPSASEEKPNTLIGPIQKSEVIPAKTIVSYANVAGLSSEKPKSLIGPIQKSVVIPAKTIVSYANVAGLSSEKPKTLIGPIQESAVVPAKTIVNASGASSVKPKVAIVPLQKSTAIPAKGLANLGNTCFFNSVMQCFLHTHQLEFYFKRFGRVTRLNFARPNVSVVVNDEKVEIEEATLSIPLKGAPLNDALKTFVMGFREGRSPSPYNLFNQISHKASRFRNMAQQDAHELMRYLLDGLCSEETNRYQEAIAARVGVPLKPFKGQKIDPELARKAKAYLQLAGRPLLDAVFGGRLLQMIKCTKCAHISERYQDLSDLSLPIKAASVQNPSSALLNGHVSKKERIKEASRQRDLKMQQMGALPACGGKSVIASLQAFTAKERLAGANAYECEKCCEPVNKAKGATGKAKMRVDAIKRCVIATPPVILTIHLNRFAWVFEGHRPEYRKMPGYVHFPLVFDLKPFCTKNVERTSPGQKDILYSLYGVVSHEGSTHEGHYMAYVKSRERIAQTEAMLEAARAVCADAQAEPIADLPLPSAHSTAEEARKAVPPGQWYYCSDSVVETIPVKQVLKKKAYLLFYERIY